MEDSSVYEEINKLAEVIAESARKKGFTSQAQGLDDIQNERQRFIAENFMRLALVHSEVSEAIEVLRDPTMDPHKCYEYVKPIGEYIEYDDTASTLQKPEGYGSELADILIRVLHICAAEKINIGKELQRKIRYNATRPMRHGGKRA